MNKILIIDDEQSLREMVSVALTQKGYEVLEAQDGATGIELARRSLPDLILCDVNMDKINGYDTLSSLRNEPTTAAIPFILMTGMADPAGMRHGMGLGADDYLPKPFTLDDLYAAVEARLKKVHDLRREAEKKLADLRANLSLMLPHELRTPLNGILAFGEILSSDTERLTAAEVAEMGKTIHDSGKLLERLIENFLIYAQLELLSADAQKIAALRQARTDTAAQFIEQQAREQASLARREQDLELELASASVAMSEEYLSRVARELIQNAFKFSSAGTQVRVALEGTPSTAIITVTDRGRGFSTEHITRIGAYMQFDRKLHEQQGQGLGLSIAKRLTELHGGSLGLAPAPGGGTTVTVKLPR